MYRRVEIRTAIGNSVKKWFGVCHHIDAANLLDDLEFPTPYMDYMDYQRYGDLPNEAFFWFTEEGWSIVGCSLVSLLEEACIEFRVLKEKEFEEEVVAYRDSYQIAVVDKAKYEKLYIYVLTV